MKKRTKKRIPAIFLAIALLLSLLSACGEAGSEKPSAPSSETSSTSTSQVSEEQSTAADELMTPYGKYPELIELHTAKRISASPNFAEGESVDDNAVTRNIQEKLNIKTITDWEVEASEFPNKLSLMIASSDLPDLFTLTPNDYLIYRQLVENGLLADLSESYENCTGDFLKQVIDSYEEKNLEPFREGDALYAIAGGRYGYEHNQLWLRKDWMEQCGITELPSTLEDIEAILTAFQENNAGGDYTGMILHFQDVGGGYGSTYSADPIFEAFGATPKTWVKDQNGEIVYGSVMPEMKKGLAVLADWYQKGLIDQQFATRSAAGAMDALFTGSQAGVAFAPWWFCYTIADLPRNDEGAEVAIVNAPLDEAGKFNVVWPGPSSDYLMVSKECGYPEAAVKMLNVIFDQGRGIDEEASKLLQPDRDANYDWSYANPTSGVNFELAGIVPDVGLLCKNWIEEGKMECGTMAEDIPSNQEMAKSAKAYADTQSLEGMGWVDYHGRYLASNLMTTPEVAVVEPAFSFTTESMADLKPNLDTLERTTFLKIVMGELPVDAFDQFVEDWYAQGGQTMTDEVRALEK